MTALQAWSGMVWHGMAWHGMAWQGVRESMTLSICTGVFARCFREHLFSRLGNEYLRIPPFRGSKCIPAFGEDPLRGRSRFIRDTPFSFAVFLVGRLMYRRASRLNNGYHQ
ncbi:hypothetical protein F4780DRAFT_474348 [Xylariomycetidae sp. FL0641]|nr:hypothetical protein F4780DRAFT_474348 [Xylariomycetidae sp. FL0641]